MMATPAHRMGALIGQALEDDCITQAEFARAVGVSPKHLNQVITGKAIASAGQLEYWAYALERTWTVGLVSREVAS